MKRIYSDAEREALVSLARLSGISDEEILRLLITGVRGAENRKERILEWAKFLGLTPTEALRKAQKAGLILTIRLPRGNPRGMG